MKDWKYALVFVVFAALIPVLCWITHPAPRPNAMMPLTHKYLLHNGQTVECSKEQWNYCGIYLYNCTNNINYYCLTNLGVYK